MRPDIRNILKTIAYILIGLFITSWITKGFTYAFHGISYVFANEPLVVVIPNVVAFILTVIVSAILIAKYRAAVIVLIPVLFLELVLFQVAFAVYVVLALLLLFIIEDHMDDELMFKVFFVQIVVAIVIAVVMLPVLAMIPFWSSSMVSIEKLDEPIDVVGLQRFIPLETACVYASDRIQVATHRIFCEDSYVYYGNDSIIYNWIIEPEGFWNAMLRSPIGAVFVYGNRFPPKIVIVNHTLEWGLHNFHLTPFYIDSLDRYVIAAAGYDKRPIFEDNIEVYRDGEVLVLVPVEARVRVFAASAPIVAGYVVVHEDGRTEYVDARDALNDPRFEDIPIVPEDVARTWVDLYAHHVGFWEYHLAHNTITIRNVGTNPQPYLLRAEDGRLYWVFVAEPPGETYSAKYIIYVDAQRLDPHIYVYELPEPMIGVSKVESYVKQYHPRFDWSMLKIEEPMPTIMADRILWKVTITTSDSRGLVAVDVVDAKTTQVLSLQPRKQLSYTDVLKAIYEYLSGELNITLPTGEIEVPVNVTTNVTELLEQVRSLRQQVDETIETLEKIREELVAIEKVLEEISRD